MALTNFPNVISSFGGAVLPFGMFTGTHFWVKPVSGNDDLDGETPETALKTLAQAQTLSTADKNDVVFLVSESNSASGTTDYQSTALDWAKDGVHLIGVNCGPMIGQRSRIAQTSTVLTIEDLFTVSANNCLIANIEVFQGVDSSTATSPRAVVISGERNHIVNCQFSGNGDTAGSMDTAGARSLAVTGGENYFKNCYIGLDTVIRGTQTAEVLVGDIARTIFEDCFFNTYTSLTTFKIVTYTAPDRFVMFKNCTLNAVQNITSAVAPTGALAAASSVNGHIIGHNSYVFGCDNVTTADDTRVYWTGPIPTVDSGLAGTVDIV